MDIDVQHRSEQSAYVARVDGQDAGLAAYRREGDRVLFLHTEVQGGGRGVGSALVAAALDDVRERGLRAVPLCSFVAAYVERNPQYADLVDAA